jgi:ribonuclease D
MAATSIQVVDGEDNDASKQFMALVDSTIYDETNEKHRIGLDCEGIDLGRNGSVELVSICFDSDAGQVFLIDFHNAARGSERVVATKKLLESTKVVKIIHDCQMDCDALHHLFGIDMVNVHDTSCYNKIITGRESINLNDLLEQNDITRNVARSKNIYRENPRFWATRPITLTMKTWASGDVSNLLLLATKQNKAVAGTSRQQEAESLSLTFTKSVADKELEILRCKIPIGRFIGSGGSNIRSLQARTNTVIYPCRDRGDGYFFVYYGNDASLEKVKRHMGC